MTIQYAVPIPEKAHVLHVGLLVPNSVEQVDPVTKAVTMVDGIQEIPVRKSHYNSLTAARKLAYVQECAEYHHPTDRAKRDARKAAWETDDKAKADATTEAARQAQEAKFIVTPHGVKDGLVAVTILHHGLMFNGDVAKGADKAEFEVNCRAAFAVYEAALQAEKAELAALAINA